MTRVGSLFSGAGALDLAVHQVLDAEPAWFVENDPAASKVLARHWPEIPNYGDITAVDWADVEPVEIVTGGFPCQDMSAAGKRTGLHPGTRSGLWSHMAYAISQLRPELVIIENVRGLLSADAHCDLEPCPWCLGDNEGRPLRALGSLCGTLAELGYDTQWHGLRAADIGAPHGRFRIFITAWPAGTNSIALRLGPERWHDGFRTQGLVSGTAIGNADRCNSNWWVTAGLQGETGPTTGPASDPDSIGQIRRRGTWGGWSGSPDHSESPADTDITGRQPGGRVGRSTGTPAERNGAPVASDSPGCGNTNQQGCGTSKPILPFAGPSDRNRSGNPTEGVYDLGRTPTVMAWGPYEPAIRRWERILDRPAPAPTRTGKRGGQQLSAEFCEWLMGWPQGWVTAVPGLTRNDQIRIAGNGVVPQQAAAALRHLLAARERAA